MSAEHVIAPKSAHALRLARGDVLRVTDVDGSQVADLVAFNADAPDEHFSQGYTRANNDKAGVVLGDHLYSNVNTPMLTVVADTVGVHDMLFPPCSAFLYRHVFGVEGKTGCREHLTAALEPFGIGFERVTDPFNVFMNTEIDEAGTMVIHTPRSSAGDHLELRAEIDLIVAVSACAADVNACNGDECTRIAVSVR
ncbi:MAG TPA: urea carboxylase-associated family protein [Solirubrobacteraceae bacterium]|nr:urea carboxylase-associated family protein [Solirubrobacteraceae bacterium]